MDLILPDAWRGRWAACPDNLNETEDDEEKAKKGPPSQGSKTLLPSCLKVLTAKCLALPLAWSRGGFGPEVPGSVWNSGAGGVERLVGLPGTLRTTQPRYLKGNQKAQIELCTFTYQDHCSNTYLYIACLEYDDAP